MLLNRLPPHLQQAVANPDYIRKEKARRSLSEFIRQAWHVLEPATPYVHGWHIDAMCEHLEAVTRGEITRLLINVPPGTMKSMCVGVFWPAWEWIENPHHRYIGTSYKEALAIRDNMKCRTLIKSQWYQDFWSLALKNDQDGKGKFENEHTGFRSAMSITSLTGERGSRVIVDDPHSVDTSKSDVSRDGVLTTFKESLGSRLSEPKTSAIVVVMQRLHQMDVSGYILKKELGYEHLMLPMEFEPKRKCYTSIGFVDPRTEEGELLFKDRFPREVVDRDKNLMGSIATAGQFQQAPAPAGGNIFKEDDFRRYVTPRKYIRVVASWDTAFKGSEVNDPSVCTVWGEHEQGFDLLDVIRERLEYPALKRLALSTAEYWSNADCYEGHKLFTMLIEDKASGQSLIQDINNVAHYSIVGIKPEGDKIIRASTCSPLVESGKVYLKEGASWLQDYLDEMTVFPNTAHDDQVDSTSQFLNWIGSASQGRITELFL